MLGLKRKTETGDDAATSSAVRSPWQKHRRKLRLRRGVAVFVILWVLIGLVWLVKFSGLLDPLLEMAAPHYDAAAAMINDPLGIDYGGALMQIAGFFILHIGAIMFIFDER